MADAEWGDWIDHDGKGCPVIGVECEVETFCGRRAIVVPSPECDRPKPGYFSLWLWESMKFGFWGRIYWPHRVKRYRVRRSAGMRMIFEALNSVDKSPAREVEDA